MTYKTNLIPPHGGYRNLKSYQMAEIIYDLTQIFCEKFVYRSYGFNRTYTRTYDQMVQAARSGKQNIVEASVDSGTSKKIELKLIGIARGSLEELLQDYEDFLRQNNFELWHKNDQGVQKIRALAYLSNKSYRTYMTYITKAESAANCLICLIHQTNFLLDRQLSSLEKEFLKKGGFTERLYSTRSAYRSHKTNRTYQINKIYK